MAERIHIAERDCKRCPHEHHEPFMCVMHNCGDCPGTEHAYEAIDLAFAEDSTGLFTHLDRLTERKLEKLIEAAQFIERWAEEALECMEAFQRSRAEAGASEPGWAHREAELTRKEVETWPKWMQPVKTKTNIDFEGDVRG